MAMDDRAIREQFQNLLGRDARPDEVQVFNEFMRENDLQPYEIGQIIQSHPEYQTKLLTQQGAQYSDLLGKSDEMILGKAQDQIRGDFTRMGRPNSSGYGAAFAGAAGDLAAQRQQQLASFYGGGYGGIRSLAAGQGQGALQRGYGLRDERRHRGWELTDYARMRDDYNSNLKTQSRRNLQSGLLNAGVNLAARGAAAMASGGTAGGMGGSASSPGLTGGGGLNLNDPYGMQGYYNGYMRGGY